MKSPQKSARERILETAEDLFYREGIHAVGIDTIIEKSGVAKMSLYRNFASKDDLVAAYLEARGQRYWQWWDGVMARNASQPRRQLPDLFEAIAVRTRMPEFRGCAFLKAAAEFPEEGSRARVVALAHKKELKKRLQGADQPIAHVDRRGLFDCRHSGKARCCEGYGKGRRSPHRCCDCLIFSRWPQFSEAD